MMIAQKRSSPRSEHRLRQRQRADESRSLAEEFPNLKSLQAELSYFSPNGLTLNGQVRYKVHVRHAKSVFAFGCQHPECVGGDFDLSHAVAVAVASGHKTAQGEVRCQGLRARLRGEKESCQNLLRYTLQLGYV